MPGTAKTLVILAAIAAAAWLAWRRFGTALGLPGAAAGGADLTNTVRPPPGARTGPTDLSGYSKATATLAAAGCVAAGAGGAAPLCAAVGSRYGLPASGIANIFSGSSDEGPATSFRNAPTR